MNTNSKKAAELEDLEPKADPKAGSFFTVDPGFVGGVQVAAGDVDRPTESLSLNYSKVR